MESLSYLSDFSFLLTTLSLCLYFYVWVWDSRQEYPDLDESSGQKSLQDQHITEKEKKECKCAS